MSDNGYSQNSIEIPRCIRRSDKTCAAIATVLETLTTAILCTSGLSDS